MDLTKLRDIDTNIHQMISRILSVTFERIGPAGQGTTGTSGTAGQIAIEGLHENGIVLVTGAESIPDGVGSVVAAEGYFTVYDGVAASPVALSGKKINYFVVDLGTAA